MSWYKMYSPADANMNQHRTSKGNILTKILLAEWNQQSDMKLYTSLSDIFFLLNEGNLKHNHATDINLHFVH